MKLGFSTWATPSLPIEETIDHLSSLGYDAIEITVLPGYSTALAELDGDKRRRIAALLKSRRLSLSAIMAYLPMAATDEETHAQHVAYVQEAISLAVDWAQNGALPAVIVGIGGRPGELDELLPRLIERLDKLGSIAQRAGVIIALEHHINTAVETPEAVQQIMAQISSPAIRLNFDISHFNVLGIPVDESITKMIPYSVHTHIKDERGRAPRHEYLIPGEGEFDYTSYLKLMNAAGYEGTISVEISKMVQRRLDYDPLAAATCAYQVVSHAFEKAGIQRLP